jgi:riboflavin kinase/FMN adenylyltransferase
MLTSLQERQKWLEQYAEVVVLKFTEVQHLTAQEFMSYLHTEQDVDVLLLGYDHRFGSDGLKGFSEYEKMAHRVGIRVLRAHECLVDAVPVSSTRIRKLLAEGQVIQANQLLGYKYALTGEVVHGNGIGKQLGFPTANIQIDALKQLPASGVYMAHTYLENKMYSVLVNIGNNPTVGNTYVSVEAYIVGYHGDLYGHKLTVSLEKFIRPEQKFDSLAELQQQILKDLQTL